MDQALSLAGFRAFLLRRVSSHFCISLLGYRFSSAFGQNSRANAWISSKYAAYLLCQIENIEME
ncbi:hypothetical protein HUU62_03210 [Rhodoferax sp. 4810]|nr:hypothetical protein [Rhodoferax jenense]